MKAYWGSGGVAPRILDLGSRWKWVVSFTPGRFIPQGKSPWYPFDRKLVWTWWWRKRNAPICTAENLVQIQWIENQLRT